MKPIIKRILAAPFIILLIPFLFIYGVGEIFVEWLWNKLAPKSYWRWKENQDWMRDTYGPDEGSARWI